MLSTQRNQILGDARLKYCLVRYIHSNHFIFQYSLTIQKVTGCSSGLGRSFVSTVYEAGHRVVATARNVASLSYIPDGSNVLKLKLDVTSRADITNALSTAVKRFGRVDVVVNNAGYAVMGDTESVPESEARLLMEILFWGPVFITQEAIRIFRETNAP